VSPTSTMKENPLQYRVRGTPVPTTQTRGTNYPKSTVGFETIFRPGGTFHTYSVEYENVHDLWAYDIAGESILKNLDFDDPDQITWFKTDSKNFVPPTLSDVPDLEHASKQIWIRH